MNPTSPATDGPQGPDAGATVPDRFSVDEVLRRVIATAEEELRAPARQLFISGVAAGLCAGSSLLASVNVAAQLEDTPYAELGAAAFYGLGFVFIVLGRYQLYTENTLTPVMLVLERRDSLLKLLRLWALVLAGNVVGATVLGALLHQSGVFEPDAAATLARVGGEATTEGTVRLLWSSVFAGVLVATMVWVVMAVRESMPRLALVLLIASVIPIARLHHCVFGTAEVVFAVLADAATVLGALRFFGWCVLGNTLGGVVFVSLLNYAQAKEAEDPAPEISDLNEE